MGVTPAVTTTTHIVTQVNSYTCSHLQNEKFLKDFLENLPKIVRYKKTSVLEFFSRFLPTKPTHRKTDKQNRKTPMTNRTTATEKTVFAF